MSYKIQSRTIFGWMDIVGTFETIKEAQEKIPKIQNKLDSPFYSITSVLRIVDEEEHGINNYYVYKKDEL
jgi:hypothetical protein